MRKFLAAALAVFFALNLTYTAGAQTLYESKTVTPVFTGLDYELSRRVTPNGLLDVHVLTVDISQQHLAVKPIASKAENGLKERLSKLMEESGAAAAVNGDFFGMAGDYSVALGLEMSDGYITSANESFNVEEPKSATFFMGYDNIPFMDYIQTDLKFFNDGQENIELTHYNLASAWTCYLDRRACVSTAEFDARFPGRCKIVAEGGVITYISKQGETVGIPEDGYVIVPNADGAAQLGKFAVGQRAEVRCESSVDLSRISSAISGAGKILSNDVYTEWGMFVPGRQPRTAIGISEDQRKLILMVVDGRSHSIGATHGEMAELMREYGAYNAMHLDGGGSSTFALKESLGPIEVKNIPSDGAERKVINGLGVFNYSQLIGDTSPVSLAIETDEYMFAGVPSRMGVYSVDQYLNKTELFEGFVLDAGDGGHYSNGYFYPSRTGYITLTLTSGAMTAAKTVRCGELAEITVPGTIRIPEGGDYRVSASGKGADGYSRALDSLGVYTEIFPPELASLDLSEPGRIVGMQAGEGYVKFAAGNAVRYSRLIVGTRDELIERFSPEGRAVSYIAYPQENAGSVGFVGTTLTGPRLELAYQMAESTATQAAYAAFDEPIEIPGQPMGLKLTVYGDNSNNWLRGRISDANGTAHFIDFARHIDWEGVKVAEAKIPAEAVYPVKLERIYVAALENAYTDTRRLYFTDITAVYPIETGGAALPESSRFSDRKLAELGGGEAAAFTDIVLLGDINYAGEEKPPGYTDIQNGHKQEFNTRYGGEFYGIYFGDTDNTASAMPAYRKTGSVYDSYRLGAVDVISLTAAKGNMFSSSAEQWQNITGDLVTAGDSVLVLFDRNPLASMPKKELELLQSLLSKAGKNIAVVSSEGQETTASVIDGVRYINLGALFGGDGSVNPGFKTLRLRFFDTDMAYSLK